MKTFILVATLFLLCSSTFAQKRGLVVLDDLQLRNTHSIFFSELAARGAELSFKEASDPNLELSHYGEYLYDFAIFFAPRADDFGGSITVDSILNFIDDGRNVIIAADSEVSDNIREVATECGVDFGESSTFVIDHFNYDVSDADGDHTLIVADDILNVPVIVGNSKAPILFRGIDQVLDPKNSLITPVVTASSTAYSYSPDDAVTDEPHSSGKEVVLISVLQARNNARVLISGSLEFFSDRFFSSAVQSSSGKKSDVSGNKDLAVNLATWAIKERGVIRAQNVFHHKDGVKEQGTVYSVHDQITYSIDIEEWNGSEWVPYAADDIQLEFVMLDPYYRIFLKHDNKGHYSVSYQVPDVYGIFTFRINYARSGYSSINANDLVTVRPFRHNEYERFIPAAYPYYVSSFSMMFGLVVFSFFFLYNRENKKN